MMVVKKVKFAVKESLASVQRNAQDARLGNACNTQREKVLINLPLGIMTQLIPCVGYVQRTSWKILKLRRTLASTRKKVKNINNFDC